VVLHAALENDDDDGDDDDDDNDVDHLLSLGIFDEHKNANRRRAIRMTKAERRRETCPVAKCEAEVDGDEKDEDDRFSWGQGHVPRFAEMTERSTVSA